MTHQTRPIASRETQAITYFQLFRYSTLSDRLLILLGCIVSMVAGIAIPLLNINFGHMIDIYIQFDELSDFHHDLLRRPRNYTTFQVGFEGMLVEKEVDGMAEIPIEVREFSEKSYMIAFNILAIGFVYFLLCYFFTVIMDKAASTIMYRTRLKFYESLLRHEVTWYDESFVMAYSSDMESRFALMEEGIGKKTGFFLYMLSTSICSLLTAVYYGWELTFVLIALTPAFAILFALVCRKQRSREEQALEDRQLVHHVAREIISMIRVVLSYGGEVKQIIRFDKVIRKSVKSEMAFKVLVSIGYGLVWFSNYLTYAVGVWYGSKLIIVSRETGSQDYTVGSIIIVFWNVLSITYFAGRTESFLSLFNSAAAAAGEIFHLIQRESCSHAAGIRPNQFAAGVQFENVSLNHTMHTESESSSSSQNNNVSNSWSRSSRKCLKDFSMRLKEGETIAVVGNAGSGKSLIPKLLTRIIEQQEGRILVGDMEIENLNLEWLRSNIGYVGMEPFIFDGTIYDNIWLGDRSSIKSDIVEAAKLANASNLIRDLSPAGLDTVVGSKGRILSPGEKQRIAIAKALLKKPKILLLDQVTRNVPQSEMRDLTLAIERARMRRTTILISDRITASVRNADHILVIQNGTVVAEGIHDELMQQKGVYKAIWVRQAVAERIARSIRSSGDQQEKGEKEEEDKMHHEVEEIEQEVIPYIDDEGDERKRQNTAGDESANETADQKTGKRISSKTAAAQVADGNSGNEDAGDRKRKDRNYENEAQVRGEENEDDDDEEEEECSPKLMSKEEETMHETDSGEMVVVVGGSDKIVTEEDGFELSAAKLDSSSIVSMTSDSSSITTGTGSISAGKHRKRSGSCFTAFSHKYSVQRIAKFMEKDFAFILMGSICSAIFGLGVPLYAIVVGEFMLVLESKDHEQILRDTKLIAAAFFALAILVAVASAASSIFFAIAASRLTQRLKSQAIRSLLTQDYDRVAGADGVTGRERLTEILCNDVEPLCEMVTQRAASYSQTAGTVLACAIYSLSLNWQMGLIAISIMPFIMYRFKMMAGSSSSSSAARELDKSQLQEQTNETTKTSKKLIHAVRSSSCLQHQIQFTPIFRKILMQDLQRKDGLLHMKGQALAVIQCIPVLAYGIVFLVGSHYIQEDTIHYSDFFKIVEGVIFGSILVSEGALFSADVRDLKGRTGYLFHLIDAKKLPDSSEFGSIPDGSDGTIHFSNVDYRSKHSPCPQLLSSVSLTVARGSSVALVAQDGPAVRSAITCLAQKLLPPDAGSVLLDGHDISSINTPWIRSKIAVITSDPQIFSFSVGENIAFGDNNRYVSFAEVVEAAKAAGIHDFIHSLAQGYDTLTDSRLILTQEQKLRLSIARALVRNPVIVILEQIDSGLDEGSMNQLQSALAVLKKGRSVICLPANLARNSEYDRVVLIQNATVQVEGSHEDLMRHSEHYFDLYKLYE